MPSKHGEHPTINDSKTWNKVKSCFSVASASCPCNANNNGNANGNNGASNSNGAVGINSCDKFKGAYVQQENKEGLTFPEG